MLLICIDLFGCGVGTGTVRVARQMRFTIFGRGQNSLRHAHCRTWVIQYDFVTHMPETSVSQPPGRGPVRSPGIYHFSFLSNFHK